MELEAIYAPPTHHYGNTILFFPFARFFTRLSPINVLTYNPHLKALLFQPYFLKCWEGLLQPGVYAAERHCGVGQLSVLIIPYTCDRHFLLFFLPHLLCVYTCKQVLFKYMIMGLKLSLETTFAIMNIRVSVCTLLGKIQLGWTMSALQIPGHLIPGSSVKEKLGLKK